MLQNIKVQLDYFDDIYKSKGCVLYLIMKLIVLRFESITSKVL